MNKKIEKLLSRCKYFFHLEAILGERPNIHPPALFDCGTRRHEPIHAVERLIGVMRENINEEEKEENEVEEVEKGEGSRSGRKEERKVEKEGECEKEEDSDLCYILQYTIVRDSENEEIRIEGESCQRGREYKGKRRSEEREGKMRQHGTLEGEPA